MKPEQRGQQCVRSLADRQWKLLLGQLNSFIEGRFVSKYQSNVDKHKWRDERRCKAEEHEHISQLTGQDRRINCAGLS